MPKSNRTPPGQLSFKLLVVTGTLLLMMTSGLLFLWAAVIHLEDDSAIINHAGKIRGQIQRAVKLEIAGQSSEQAINDASSLLLEFIDSEHLQHRLSSPLSQTLFHQLNNQWLELLIKLRRFHDNPDPSLKKIILMESEALWANADNIVMTEQLSAEKFYKKLWIIVGFFALHVGTLIGIIWVIWKWVHNHLEQEAHFDKLTGALNRCSFAKYASINTKLTNRHHLSMTGLLIDIDHFKTVNDNYGHSIGDEVLIEVVNRLNNCLRESDMLFRVGGEEFFVLAPHTLLEDGIQLAEKLLRVIREEVLEPAGQITISLGVASYQYHEHVDEWFRRIDDALYRAKNEGRNRFVVYAGPTEQKTEG